MQKRQGFLLIIFCLLANVFSGFSQSTNEVMIIQQSTVVHPLDTIKLICRGPGTITVTDAKNRTYFKAQASHTLSFLAGGAAGIHTITLKKENGKLSTTSFTLEAKTAINDGGKIAELFDILYNGMLDGKKKGYFDLQWKYSSYKMYVPWDLDNNNVMNGIQYFFPYGDGLTNLLRQTQREDGMIWSFVSKDNGFLGSSSYYETAYGPINFFKRDKDLFFVRQPVDNHSDYNYVNMFYKHWRASGNNEWMKKTLPSAALALDYC